jgi:hypothetical protein
MKYTREWTPKGVTVARWMNASEMKTPGEERLPHRCNNRIGECGSDGGAKL